jgi:hypothetical protein
VCQTAEVQARRPLALGGTCRGSWRANMRWIMRGGSAANFDPPRSSLPLVRQGIAHSRKTTADYYRMPLCHVNLTRGRLAGFPFEVPTMRRIFSGAKNSSTGTVPGERAEDTFPPPGSYARARNLAWLRPSLRSRITLRRSRWGQQLRVAKGVGVNGDGLPNR